MYKQEGGPCCLKQGWLQRLRTHSLHASPHPHVLPGCCGRQEMGVCPTPAWGP